jgi:hypothetical protein
MTIQKIQQHLIRNELKNKNSKRSFLFKTWDSKNHTDSHLIINDYDDYKQIDEFYNTLKDSKRS